MTAAPETPDWRAAFTRLEGAYAPKTIKSYLVDLQLFEAWCRDAGVPMLPATPEAVGGFLAAQAEVGHKAATIRRRIYAIARAHRMLRLEDPTGDDEVRLSLRRIQRALHVRPRQARPLTRDCLEAFLAVQPESPWGTRNRALLSIGYDLLARRSELVALRLEDLSWRRDGTLHVLVRRSKNDPFGRGRIALTSKRSRKLVDAWLDQRGGKASTNWLFCPIYHGHVQDRPLNASFIRKLLKATAIDAGFAEHIAEGFSGHSMRVGAAQDLLRAGHSTAAIMRAGGWKSHEVLARYLENADYNVWEG